jgi:hypothetical protein
MKCSNSDPTIFKSSSTCAECGPITYMVRILHRGLIAFIRDWPMSLPVGIAGLAAS